MQTAKALRESAHTFLIHIFGCGLDDDRYTVADVLVRSTVGVALGEARGDGGRWCHLQEPQRAALPQ